ncbi:hypothetical protein [Synechocystis sp. LKSZ1]|uniref:hypothetical protein n=1 Tax=Synechocystis sp. LKSZ1 TaxID=3144951 RepID=UPI00336BE8F2
MKSIINRVFQELQRTEDSTLPLLLASRATHICGTTDPQETFETVLSNIQTARQLGYIEKMVDGNALCDRYVNLVHSVELEGYASKADWFREEIIQRMYDLKLHSLIHSYFGAYEINWMHHTVVERVLSVDLAESNLCLAF